MAIHPFADAAARQHRDATASLTEAVLHGG